MKQHHKALSKSTLRRKRKRASLSSATSFSSQSPAPFTITGMMPSELPKSGATRIDFLGIGAQKAGTTWLYHHLNAHPQVQFPAGKEVHFWDTYSWMAKGIDEWLNLFPYYSSSIKQGEITPAYGFLEQETIKKIYRHCPHLQIFYSLRNPIDRAWSAAKMMLERCEMLGHEASDQWFIDVFNSEGSRKRGDYETCLVNWLAVFPKSQVHLILFDDLCQRPRGVIQKLAAHLDINPGFYEQLPEEAFKAAVNPTPQIALRPSLRGVLQELYDEKIDRLSHLIQRDLSHWRRISCP